jgi:bacterial/archaeal transporter family-2 protein
MEIVLAVFLGLLGGVAVGIQSPVSGILSERVGGAAGSFIIHFGGAVFSGLLLLLRRGENIQNWRNVPWYMYGLGGLGLVLYLTLSYTVPRLGATAAVTLIVVGQLLISFLADTFGWFGLAARPVESTRVVAIGLLLLGSYLMVK